MIISDQIIYWWPLTAVQLLYEATNFVYGR